MEVDVLVRKGDHVIGSIRRPLREISGQPAVTYRGKLWPLHDGTIDIQPVPAPELEDVSVAGGDAEPASGMTMDEDQIRVINADASARILVAAGPGSGKTEITARRIARLLENGLSPARILVLSFSRSAVRTLTRRLAAVSSGSGIEDLRHVAIRTLDSWAFRLLRLNGEPPGKLLSRPHEANIEALCRLIEGDGRDRVRELLGDRRHVFIDEFQDLTGCRARLAREMLGLLAPPGEEGCGFTLLGDPAQAIYGFASKGTDDMSGMDVWEEVRARYGSRVESIPLRRNHRSAPDISAFSKGLRAVLESDLPPAEKLEKVRKAVHGLPAPDGELGPGWAKRPFATSAILARTNGDAIRIMQKLLGKENGSSARIILKAGGFAPPPPAWIAALLAPFTSSSLPRSRFDAIYSHVVGKIGAEGRAALCLPDLEVCWTRLLHAAGQAGEDRSLDISQLRARLNWPDAFPDDELLPEDGLYVTTVHQSKGMEFQEVHLLESDEKGAAAESPEEEASVGFVGVTRAALKIGRIPSDAIYTALRRPKGSDRLLSWRNKRVNLEMGLPGDVSASGFVDEAVHGSAEAVAEVQKLLLEDSGRLVGRKVLLCKVAAPGNKAFYDIHLQLDDGEAGQKIGRTGRQLTTALLDLLWKRGFSLPTKIRNLRIAGLGTMTAGEETDAQIPTPWNGSRLWLGCSLAGTGDFTSIKRTGGKK